MGHTNEHDGESEPAGVDDPGLFEDCEHLWCALGGIEGLFRRGFDYIVDAGAIFGNLYRGFSCFTDNGKHGAFDRVWHRAVGQLGG